MLERELISSFAAAAGAEWALPTGLLQVLISTVFGWTCWQFNQRNKESYAFPLCVFTNHACFIRKPARFSGPGFLAGRC